MNEAVSGYPKEGDRAVLLRDMGVGIAPELLPLHPGGTIIGPLARRVGH
jgi:hypothetical protein